MKKKIQENCDIIKSLRNFPEAISRKKRATLNELCKQVVCNTLRYLFIYGIVANAYGGTCPYGGFVRANHSPSPGHELKISR